MIRLCLGSKLLSRDNDEQRRMCKDPKKINWNKAKRNTIPMQKICHDTETQILYISFCKHNMFWFKWLVKCMYVKYALLPALNKTTKLILIKIEKILQQDNILVLKSLTRKKKKIKQLNRKIHSTLPIIIYLAPHFILMAPISPSSVGWLSVHLIPPFPRVFFSPAPYYRRMLCTSFRLRCCI